MTYEVTKTLKNPILTFWTLPWTLICKDGMTKSTYFNTFMLWYNSWLLVQQLITLR